MEAFKLNSSLYPLYTCPPVTDEEFNLFHSMDRELFTRLIIALGRDPAESLQVMGLWMWLERQTGDINFIKRLLTLPPVLLNQLADEGVLCLICAENEDYPCGDLNQNPNDHELVLLPNVIICKGISLRCFHVNRIAVLNGVTKIIATICCRAFSDILKRVCEARNMPLAPNGVVGRGNLGHMSGAVTFMGSIPEQGESSRIRENRNDVGVVVGTVPILYQYPPNYVSMPFVPVPHPPPMGFVPVHMAYDMAAQRQMIPGNELGVMLSQNLTISEQRTNANALDGEEEVSPDDRTIFLTFSKGYPISKNEVRQFFTKRFGDFIEDLIMQEVEGDEQVLYAKMVARSGDVISGIVGRNKAKYSINGKHVWARKYVKKTQNPRSPTRGGGSGGESSQQH